MPTNKIIERMRRGEKALGLALSFYSDELIELAELMDLDFVSYYGQPSPVHGPSGRRRRGRCPAAG